MKVKLPIARIDAFHGDIPDQSVDFRYSQSVHDEKGRNYTHVSISHSMRYQEWLEKGRPLEIEVEITRPPH